MNAKQLERVERNKAIKAGTYVHEIALKGATEVEESEVKVPEVKVPEVKVPAIKNIKPTVKK